MYLLVVIQVHRGAQSCPVFRTCLLSEVISISLQLRGLSGVKEYRSIKILVEASYSKIRGANCAGVD